MLFNKIKGLTDEFKLSTSISGHKDELKISITMFKPSTLSAPFGLARLQEEVSRRKRGINLRSYNVHNPIKPNNSKVLNVTMNKGVTPLKLDLMEMPANANFNKRLNFLIKRLTQQ